MFPVYPLISGINGAANGTAQLFRKGTSTRVHYYTEFDGGSSLIAANNDVDLDGNGRAVVYVDQYVDVKVFDSNGVHLSPTFTTGGRADAIEVVSPSFTGIDPDDASTAVNKPVTLDDVLDRWTSSGYGDGEANWKISFEGTTQSIPDALGALTYLVYNVQDPEYGAVGDGTTDDTAAIQACIDACYDSGNGGGVVFFPPGTYKVTDAITVSATVALRGSGAASTEIASTLSTGDSFVFTSSATATVEHSGIKFSQSVANGNNLISAAAANVVFSQCFFDLENIGAIGISVTATYLAVFVDCNFYFEYDAPALQVAGLTTAIVARCRFEAAAFSASTTGIAVLFTTAGANIIDGCQFDMSAITSGTYSIVNPAGSGTISNCQFIGGGGTCTAMAALNSRGSEYGNSFDANVDARYATPPAGGSFASEVDENMVLITRRGATERVLNATADANKTVTFGDAYEILTYAVTGTTTDLTITLAESWLGSDVRVIVINESGGGFDIIFDSPVATEIVTEAASATYTIANGKIRSFVFTKTLIGDNVEAWVALSESGDMDQV